MIYENKSGVYIPIENIFVNKDINKEINYKYENIKGINKTVYESIKYPAELPLKELSRHDVMNGFILNCNPMYSVYGRDRDPWTWGNNVKVTIGISNSIYKHFYKKYKKMTVTWQSWKFVSKSVTQYLYIDETLVQ